ncbi:heme exporter protein CcmD [Achromobacter sp. K91]|nr:MULTISPECIES: heme exporter protein CcmD [Achromobacter]PTN52265.1 heme exporter protein CcmD [Achromobacter xylosoxidans]MBD9420587.1 heme exporter protein CcmD [Achromobacter sp. ACM04]MDQ1760667.1 heme exporter protein CcmD [Achromobacter aegrifaciens]RIJ03293.1 heme exporter protein CcmD [Achromobacter sp. K91]RSF00321.1 heme exporter protein CcmD [Achromobacter aegrifaciens]
MHWSSLGEFLAMGGYALYVWGSLLMTAFLLGSEQLLLARRRRAILAGPPPVQWREGGDE